MPPHSTIMFIGHNAVGFASKRFAPRTSLGLLMAAPMLLDLLWPIFLLLGIEHVRIAPGDNPFLVLDLYDYPWTHSLLMSLVWAALFAGLYWWRTRYRAGAVVLLAGVFSHWVLDFITHRPDMPLNPGGPEVGMGLWNSIVGTLIVESLLFVAGVAMYVRSTQARDRIGSIGFWALVVFLAVLYIASVIGPPPPNVTVLAWGSLSGWIFPLWAGWVDRHRSVSLPSSGSASPRR